MIIGQLLCSHTGKKYHTVARVHDSFKDETGSEI